MIEGPLEEEGIKIEAEGHQIEGIVMIEDILEEEDPLMEMEDPLMEMEDSHMEMADPLMEMADPLMTEDPLMMEDPRKWMTSKIP